MNLELVLLWFVTLLPIVISPGPANILYAASGSAFGVRGTVPFWLGTNITSVFQTLAVGFGLNYLITRFPGILDAIRYVGIAFLLYLAYKFFRLSTSYKEALTPLSFKDGVIVEALNAKYLLIPMIMFSQFYRPELDGHGQIVFLTLALVSLTLTTSMIWIVGGKTLAMLVSKRGNQQMQGLLFGSLLTITALWLFVSG
ncbi:threonine transporter [Solemya pervernicosa gill symbiont]|uniref:Threonine transporter n=2 Tax=Gammaproteobacteria incertae sedis TaxID=118884 RepID=A0A1T2L6M8_9GAMM|nr:LysE family translocator [Candidatus Reidiella endopervernicosa]OOZ40596.1 threonine transporter [Solemya pervernicosa gill symbiont]QKQ26607.1 LysE family translocator [Candidatus Reidiella endopervernicosa]